MLPLVLVVDDDDAFQFLLGYSLKRSRLRASVQHLADGEDLLDYLSRKGRFSDGTKFPFPAIVLLDLKMRRLTGFDVLQWRQTNPDAQRVPFFVLSSSDLDRDKQKARELGADSYLVKPMTSDGLVAILDSIAAFLTNGRIVPP